VREFRSSINNIPSYVYELPGGSSFEEGKSPATQALEEVKKKNLGKLIYIFISCTKRRVSPSKKNEKVLL
jgi:hypothetical protein